MLIRYAARNSQAELIAEKVETAQQYDMVSSQGVQLFQGYWFARPSLVETKLLSPAQASIVHLINLVRKQTSTDDIEEVLKKDAGLAFNLMRLINSAGFGLNREITSFRQAVMLLGLKSCSAGRPCCSRPHARVQRRLRWARPPWCAAG